jgi:IS30 family transposase
MKSYSRVSYEERCQIDAFLKTNYSLPEIATLLGRSKSTIYRELKRNSRLGIYTPSCAHAVARKRYRSCRKKSRLTPKLENFVHLMLEEGWSPEQIAGRLRSERGVSLSHTTIYRELNSKKGNKGAKRFLRRFNKRGGGRTRQRRRYQEHNRIHNRPKVANERRRIGDWERDTMHTLNGKQILVCSDRKSRLTKLSLLHSRKNTDVDAVTERLLKETRRRSYTMTNDNGSDFKGSKSLKIPVFFCDPMKPQQRGTVENTIGLLRQYIGRKTEKNWDFKRF